MDGLRANRGYRSVPAVRNCWRRSTQQLQFRSVLADHDPDGFRAELHGRPNLHLESERYKFQFRAELFNAFNRVTFDGPYYDGTVYATQSPQTFGLINSTNPNYPSRVIQLAGKFTF